MQYKIICLTGILFSCLAIGQTTDNYLIKKSEEVVKLIDNKEKNGWFKKGKVTFLFNQANFNNWVAGGESNLSGALGIIYEIHYKNDNTTWDNIILANYGIIRTQNATFNKKSDDRLELNSIYGSTAFGNWYYSFIGNFRTQFTTGYNYTKSPLPEVFSKKNLVRF